MKRKSNKNLFGIYSRLVDMMGVHVCWALFDTYFSKVWSFIKTEPLRDWHCTFFYCRPVCQCMLCTVWRLRTNRQCMFVMRTGWRLRTNRQCMFVNVAYRVEAMYKSPVPVCECCVQDAGYVQIASAEKLRPFIQSKPVVLGRPQPAQEDIASRMVSCFPSLPQLKTGVTLYCNVRGQIHSIGWKDCVQLFFITRPHGQPHTVMFPFLKVDAVMLEAYHVWR